MGWSSKYLEILRSYCRLCLGRGGACGERLATSGASLGHRDAWTCLGHKQHGRCFFSFFSDGFGVDIFYTQIHDYHMIQLGELFDTDIFRWMCKMSKSSQTWMVQVWNFHEFCPEHKEYCHLHSIRGVSFLSYHFQRAHKSSTRKARHYYFLYAEIMSLFAQYRNFSGFQWNLDSHQSVAGHEKTWGWRNIPLMVQKSGEKTSWGW